MTAGSIIASWEIRAALASGAIGIAGAVLSVFVVLRRWAFMGEGISHAGFSGAGTALLLSVALPGLNNEMGIFLFAAAFALATSVAVAWLSRSGDVAGDTAMGIFVSVTLAWGFIGSKLHDHLMHSADSGVGNYLLGEITRLSPVDVMIAVVISTAVIATIAALSRQIISYCFDPVLAEVSGVRAGMIHYLLLLLIGVVIVMGMRLAGILLAPALLVLPGATGLAVSRRLRIVMAVSTGGSLVASVLGILIARHWRFVPPAPAIVVVLFLEFAVAHLWGRMRKML